LALTLAPRVGHRTLFGTTSTPECPGEACCLTPSRSSQQPRLKRIQDVNEVAGGGPLQWLPGIPHRLAADPHWRPYLNARSHLVADLAGQIRTNAAAEAPAWAAQPHAPVPARVERRYTGVARRLPRSDPGDLRPTGPPQLGHAGQAWQQHLDKRLATANTYRMAMAATAHCRSSR
jgi:hypothetical protein